VSSLTLSGAGLLLFGLLPPLLVFFVNPLLIWLLARKVPPRPVPESGTLPDIALIVAVHNGAAFMAAKLENCLALDYPPEKREIIVVADGCDDATEAIAGRYQDRGVRLLRLDEHQGKTWALNAGVAAARGEVLVFSDVDAMLAPEALRLLVAGFADLSVGGVCGQRLIGEGKDAFGEAQARYIDLDSRLKIWESRLGTLTANDGKLYAIRRSLYAPLPPAVTDDLFLCLAVVRQGRNFLFEPRARAWIPTPSRGPGHELERRRRIVAASLRGIALQKALLDPRRYGFFAWRLGVNKVLRRLLPLTLPLLFAGTALLLPEHPFAWMLLLPQGLGYALAAGHGLAAHRARVLPRPLARLAALAFYVVLGMYGTWLGLVDFLRGRAPHKWVPRKSG
jgi:glycosyltransferase involved in cell wall biosynthesis